MRGTAWSAVVTLLVLAIGLGTTAAPIQGPDTATQGNWIGVYGADGYILPGFYGTNRPGTNADDLSSLTGYVEDYEVTFHSTGAGAGRALWTGSTTDVRAPQNPLNPAGTRRATCIYDNDQIDVTLKLGEPATFQLGLYLLDWDTAAPGTRQDKLIVPDAPPVTATQFRSGHWYTATVEGSPIAPVNFSIQDVGPSNGVVSAVTFDLVDKPARLLGTDTTTQGTWVGTYGSDGYILPGFVGTSKPGDENDDRHSLPSYIANYALMPAGSGGRYRWLSSTSDPRAVQDPDNPTGPRKANCIFDGSRLDAEINVTHAVMFDLGLYVLDWDGQPPSGHRVETIDMTSLDIDPVVASEFRDGRWYLYRGYADPNHPLTFSLTPSASNAVVSAITFDNVFHVPEPATLSLLGAGLLAAARRRRRR